MKTTVTQLLLVCLLALAGFTSCYNEDNKIQATCFDDVQNQDEVMIDCGGPNCPECLPTCDNNIWDVDPDNAWVELGVDCGGPCPSCCGNGTQDAFETWVDCGGPECEPCLPCNNGIQDGGETGIDCDDDDLTLDCPPCFDLCADGLHNGQEECTDCGGPNCPSCNNLHCTNGVFDNFLLDQNGNPRPYDHLETGIDCGGCLCPSCFDLCNDGILNGNELGIDCGGPDCGIACIQLCMDGIQNGFETGIDCGGPDCSECVLLCNDGTLNGNETNVDCGGPVCGPCSGPDEYISWFADGVHYEGSIITLEKFPTNPNTLTFTATSILAGPPAFTFNLSADPFQGWLIGDYPANSASSAENNATYTDPTSNDYVTTTSVSGLNFNVAEIIPLIGGNFQGTFSGTMLDGLGETVTITNGEFKSSFDN